MPEIADLSAALSKAGHSPPFGSTPVSVTLGSAPAIVHGPDFPCQKSDFAGHPHSAVATDLEPRATGHTAVPAPACTLAADGAAAESGPAAATLPDDPGDPAARSRPAQPAPDEAEHTLPWADRNAHTDAVRRAELPDTPSQGPANPGPAAPDAASSLAFEIPTSAPHPTKAEPFGPVVPPAAPPDTAATQPPQEQAVIALHRLREGPFDLALSPEELGRLRFEMVTRGDAVTVMLSAERPETMDLLRRHAEALLLELRLAGFGSASLSFGQWGQPPSQPPSAPLSEGAEPALEGVAMPVSSPRYARLGGESLNLRL
jgi:flagellar hook-length control protein FliK